jgi:putative SOS response-associated peptidase YedK
MRQISPYRCEQYGVPIYLTIRTPFKAGASRCEVPASCGFAPFRLVLRDAQGWHSRGCGERWRDPASGETVRTFTVITGEPNALCALIHNRMPVILDAADWQTWLGEVPVRSDELQALLRPFPADLADLMEAHMIGPRIDNVNNDDARLIVRLKSA